MGMSIARKPYPSDVFDEEWALVAPYLTLLPEAAGQREHSLREVFNGLRYIVKTGAPWRWMPHDLPPLVGLCGPRRFAGGSLACGLRWAAVYQQAQRWLAAGCFDALAEDLRGVLRLAAGRKVQPSAVILDSRTLRSSPESGERAGYDGAKRKQGSKLHLAVDTLGHLLALHVTPASAGDRAEVGRMAEAVQAATGTSVKLAYVDQGYDGEKSAEIAREHGIELEVVKLPDAKRGFVLLPRRWVVEVVFTQMTKADVLALRIGGQHVTDLDLGIGDDHPIDEQQDELSALLEARRGQAMLHPCAESL
jgi:transposase